MRRIERARTRRRVATQATLSTFLVVTAAFGATRVIDTTPTGSDSVVQQPQPSEKPDKSVPAETPKPKPTKAPAKPKPTTVAKPTTKPVYEPKPTYTKSYEPKPEPTYEKPGAAGLSAELYPYTEAAAGAEMQWKVKAWDGAGRLLRIELVFGDGGKKVYEPETPCGGELYVKQFFPHTYASAGTYNATATVTTGGCGAATETKSASASVKVTSVDGNGPAAPTVSAEQVDAAIAKLALHGADSDGWVKKFYVDWGDGSESYAGPRPFDGCQAGKPSAWDTTATHEYASPGTYTVKVTVMSTNCDGGDGQTTTISLSVTA